MDTASTIGKLNRPGRGSGVNSAGSLPPVDPSQRLFDAILNYASHRVAEMKLQQSCSFVVRDPSSIREPFSASDVEYERHYPEADIPPPHSHRVHTVPPTAPIRPARSLDRFVSAFSRQPVGLEAANHTEQHFLNRMQESVVHLRFDRGNCIVLSGPLWRPGLHLWQVLDPVR